MGQVLSGTHTRRYKNAVLAFLFIAAQLTFPLAASSVMQSTALAAPICVNDSAGANDKPEQKDLTKLCVDYAGLPTTVQTTWNWDELGTSGANTMDACNLFDTDGDGNINYAVCVTTQNTPATFQALTTYSCGDDKIDRCTSPATTISNGTTSCSVSQKSNDPFPAGTNNPKDTEGTCTIQLSTVGGASAKLIDVCSYPSSQPNSDPSDCIIARDDYGKVELIKQIEPDTNTGKFNLTINGPLYGDAVTVNNVGDNGTTGEIVVKKGTVEVSETAGTGTSLSNYTTSIICRDKNGTGNIITSSNPTGSTNRELEFTLQEDADVICVITNSAKGSITIIKDAQPNSATDFAFTTTGTGLSNFSLDDDTNPTLSNTKVFNGLTPGSYSVTESAVNGWDLSNLSCSGGTHTVTNRTANITLSGGDNIICTFVNKKRGTITVNKVTNPANNPTSFSVTASGTGTIANSATRTLSTTQSVTYDVEQGTYAISENLANTPGWAETSNTCTNLIIDASNLNRSCTITNTKLAKLKIVKDAAPNNSQDFGFTTTGTGLTSFTLDDDADAALSNQQQFVNLLPGPYSITEGAVLDQQGKPLWDLTGLTCSGTPNYSQNNTTLNVTLAADDNITCTFTNTQRGSIHGTKFESNADASSVGTLDGWTINLLTSGNIIATTTTDSNGDYSFNNLTPDNYDVNEVLQSGWTQIYDPLGFTLNAGENKTNVDLKNFKNGTISGFKWNDLNGDMRFAEPETKLSGWTLQLKQGDSIIATTTTDASGNYSFTNITPGTYTVCEVQQSGWTQTYPSNDSCYSAVIDLSGENESGNNFGNQGRGTIQVLKNVDTDGDGDIDITGATDWTWDINASGNYSTGSVQNVPAGTYTISEDQKTNYHVTSSSCSDEKNNEVSEGLDITVSPGENVICTFTNTRDTGYITINKEVNPANDDGLFNLRINDATYAGNVGNGGTTGKVQVQTGIYTVDETAGTNTDLDDYVTTYTCEGSESLGGSSNGTTIEEISVSSGDEIVCTFTNTKLASLTIIKDAMPFSEQDFKFTVEKANHEQDNTNARLALLETIEELESQPTSFLLDDDTDPTLSDKETLTQLALGTYYITEQAVKGWDLTDIDCGKDVEFDQDGSVIAVTLEAGAHITCTFTNTQRSKVTIIKDAQPNTNQEFKFTARGDSEETHGFVLTDNGTEPELASQAFSNLVPGMYEFTETPVSGWTPSSISCGEGLKDGIATYSANGVTLDLKPGAHMICYFVNTQDTGTITINKKLTPATDPGKFNLFINNWAYAINIGNDGTTGAVKLPTGTYTVSESAYLGTLIDGYESSYTCTDGTGVIRIGNGTSAGQLKLSKNQNIVCTFVNNKGEVLSVVTPTPVQPQPALVNTGFGVAWTILAGVSFIMAVGTLAFATKRYDK